MKKQILVLLVVLSGMTTACQGSALNIEMSNVVSYQSVGYIDDDSTLVNVQDKIYGAFVQSLIAEDLADLNEVKTDLTKLYKAQNQNLIQYWRAYLQYYESIFYIKAQNSKQSEKSIDEGIAMLKAMKNKNSEDYALLAMLQSFSIQFKGMKAMFISKSIQENANKAAAIDPNNLRAYFVLGSNDFYTPEQYGGGQLAKDYLLKAVELPEQTMFSPSLPSWGKAEAYELLIKTYLKTNDLGNAKKYYAEAVAAYPNNYMIGQLAKKLVEK